MKSICTTFFALLFSSFAFAQSIQSIEQLGEEFYYNEFKQLNFVRIKAQHTINDKTCEKLLLDILSSDGKASLRLLRAEQDEFGQIHKRYAVLSNGLPIYNKMVVAHFKQGRLTALNGDLYAMNVGSTQFSLSESEALQKALAKVHAKKYKWENTEEEAAMREMLNQPNFTYYPSGKRVFVEFKGEYRAAFQFEVYAEEPLYKANVFVDATNGLVLAEQNLICNIDVPATAATKYSGTQTLTCDQVSSASYRLRETQRGLGIETYNMNHTTSYLAADFTNTSTSWTTTGADQAATDAHWGAEKTYDFYMNRFSRNSIDNMGYKLRSYVHYSNNYNNAFWDGTRMTYGDGNGSLFTILTAIDVCGHEITHGLVSNTSGLNGGGTGEADALNEGFADIFGTSVERYARPSNYNWKMGSDITPNGNGIRNMQFPKLLGDPDTYLGQYWDPNGEPHKNAGPALKWFYLLVSGGTGTNDNNNAYTVVGLGNIDAEKIAYRALTYYFTPSTNYAAARVAAIQAAKDIFGSCANQVVQTTNAWYAVGVGPQFVPNQIAPNFYTSNTSICVLPASLIFTNTTANGITYTWNYGDGSAVSTATTGFHTYTANGSYNVKLVATGCNNTLDSIVKSAYVVINVPSFPVVSSATICENTSAVISATANATIKWFSLTNTVTPVYVGSTFTTPILNLNTTYYVANSITNTPVIGGRLSNINGAYLANANQWLTFDVVQSGMLNSVVMYAQTAGNRYIELRNSTANIVNSTVVNLSVGANTVVLNFPLSPGTNYQLGLTFGSTCDLYRSSSGNTFPYSIGNCVNITGSSTGSTYYYWFYSWSVTKDDCMSPLAMANVNVNATVPSTIAVPSIYFCKDDAPVVPTATPSGGNFYGLGMSSGAFNPSVGNGVYFIHYSTNDINGCLRTDSLEVQVTECSGIKSQQAKTGWHVYPNPVKTTVVVKGEYAFGNTIHICDLQGREVYMASMTSESHVVDLPMLAKGLYLLRVLDAKQIAFYTQKLVVE